MSGLNYRKLDLHTHTPASKCYRHKDHTPEQIVQSALDKDLAGIAITDHNSAAWIDKMRDASEGSDLVIFPGVEVSMSEGFHLVALFDPSTNQKQIEGLLSVIGIRPEDHGMQDALCKKSVYDVVNMIHELDGLAILAHIDTHKGAFFEQAKQKDDDKISVPINCSKLFNEANYDAVECVYGCYPDGFDEVHQFKRFPAFYQSSDNPDPEKPTRHSLDGLGALYSWFKLDQVNLEGLRQCFADPGVRIRLMGKLNDTGYPKVVSMRIGGSGFLRNQLITFHEGLNSVIGGKGVGKSLIVEFLRFALVQPPNNPALASDHASKLEKQLEPGNTVEIVYELGDGTRYNIERQFVNRRREGGLVTAEKCVHEESREVYAGDVAAMFPILAYSQTEVIKIAEDKNAQLQLIDRFIEQRSFEKEIADIRLKLSVNDKRFSAAIQAKGELDQVQLDLNTLKTQIETIDRSLKDPLFDAMKRSEEKKSVLDRRYAYLGDSIEQVQTWSSTFKKVDDLPAGFDEDEDAAELQNLAERSREVAVASLKKLAAELVEIKKSASDRIMGWMPEFDRIEAEYKELLEEIGGDRKAKESQRRRLETDKGRYESRAKELEQLIADLEPIIVEREALLDLLEGSHRRYFEVRKAKFDELATLSEGKLQLVLEHAADPALFEENLVDLLKGGANAPSVSDRRKIARNLAPRRLVQLVLDRNSLHLANESELSELWAERVIEKLWSADNFTDVLALQHNSYPADVPSIRFRKEGGVYGELNELSVGQKCTALLIIALCDGSMPVIIDQPEDALDIASVWEDVAKKLRRGKDTRQFILTTHNSSVAVGSDSDQFIVLKAGATSGKVVFSGAIDRSDVRESVIDHLEGGPEPYRLRAQKYNLR